jgi:hypothetical protein
MRRHGGMTLSIFAATLIAEVFLYIQLLRGFIVLVGTWHDVGSNFMGYWLLAIIPGAVVFGAVVGIIHVKLIRGQPHLQRKFMIAVYVANLILLLGSMAYYTAFLHK